METNDFTEADLNKSKAVYLTLGSIIMECRDDGEQLFYIEVSGCHPEKHSRELSVGNIPHSTMNHALNANVNKLLMKAIRELEEYFKTQKNKSVNNL
jgi:hypothetical protein